jgi:hypothetical protein
MSTLYLVCATIGGTILVLQTLLLVMGGGGETDADVDPGDLHDGDVHDAAHGAAQDAAADAAQAHLFLKVLSFKTLVAFVTFFGLGGLASLQGGVAAVPTLVIALGAGALALYLVAYLMSALAKLHSKGNLDVRNAVGATGKVYLRVPGSRAGHGKVTVVVQGRKVELKAVTAGAEIATGAEVTVLNTSGADSIEVAPVDRSVRNG